MTERKKLSLSKPTQAAAPDAPRKPPVRAGNAPRKRMTAAEAAQGREEAAAARLAAATAALSPRPDPRAQRRSPEPGSPERRQPAFDGRRGPASDRRDPREGGQGERRHEGRRDEAYRNDSHRNDPRRADPRSFNPEHVPAPPQARTTPDDGRVRLSKLMSERGLSSRREADEWIQHGWVRVNGEVVDELGSRFDPDVDITIDPTAQMQQSDRVTILIHKPIGYVSAQAEDGYEPAVVLVTPENRWADDRMPLKLTRGHLRHLAVAGRLDIDSTGLLVLTQDGRIAKQLIGENSGVEKEYLVRVQAMSQPDAENVQAIVPPEVLERLRFGLELDGRQLKPAQVSWQNEHQLRFVLREGRKRQIRRMCEQVGLVVTGLKRVRMGSVTLSKLPLGQWRFLRPDERF